MQFYLYAWIASIAYGLYTIVAKLIGKYKLKNIWQFSFFSLLFGGLTITAISLANGATFPVDWTFILLAGLFGTLSFTAYIAALKRLDISVLAPLYNIRVVITVFLGVILLNEVLTARSLWLVGLVVFAGFFATMDERFSIRSFFHKSVGVGLLYMAILSIQSVFINRAIDSNDYWTANMWMGLLAILFSFVLFYPRFKTDVRRSKPRDYIGVLILAVLGGLGDLAAYKAFSGNVGISSVIISLPISMVLAFFFSILKPSLLEKHTFKVYVVRFSAAAVMIWSALQLSGLSY
ncbi:MAG: EamA family transporter [Patescibacteria group bacterium]